jgi:sec-independent protein translocase protein TatA
MGSMSLMHWVIVLVVVLLLFGSGKISTLMGDTAKGIKAFKKGMKEEDDTPPSASKTIDSASAAAAKEKDRATSV